MLSSRHIASFCVRCVLAPVAIGLAALPLLPRTAEALYLDPAASGALLQGAIALVIATMATAGIYWRVTLSYVRRLFHRDSGAPIADRDDRASHPTKPSGPHEQG